ncbi:hypothetical protein [Thermococcus sp.]|uniref:hypothetical protein n=1 Tax=Thermococcus sp. TaxID=35749 RepID=UPI0026194FDE|nr:hypothetical protein [Thermococcus sp.]
MKFEVLTKEDMNALSRELSQAGIMNRTAEELSREISHYIVIEGTYAGLLERADGIEPLEEYLEALRSAYDELLSSWRPGEERPAEKLFDESDLGKLMLVSALIEAGSIEEEDGRFVLREKPPLDVLRIEVRFPIDEIEEYLEEIDERFNPTMVTEYTLEKRYCVEVLEVERKLIEEALDIAREYATEESMVGATFDGIARSVLAEKILKLTEKHRKKNELIEAVMEMEPIVVRGGSGRVNIYYDEDAVEDFLKTLQTLGYIKVKGNRVWV